MEDLVAESCPPSPLVEFRETRAAQDFFSTCRSPEACCELTLQVRAPRTRVGFMPPVCLLTNLLAIPCSHYEGFLWMLP